MFTKSQLCSIFSLLFISSISISMENPLKDKNNRINITPLNTSFAKKTNEESNFTKKSQSMNPNLGSVKNNNVFEGILISDLEFALKTAAPEDALDVIEHLKDPSLLDDGTDRSRFFVGEPGTGKTTLAKAIAYKMHTEAQWGYTFINSTEILTLGSKESSRNQAAINLGNLLKSIIDKNGPMLLIIDEVNQLLENSDNEHYDTNTTSTLLWTFLDSQNYNDNFFFIGIANRLNKVPKPLKSRILLRVIRFKEMADPATKRDLFLNKLINQSTQLHSEVDNTYIETLIKNTPGIAGRDFHELALKTRKLSWKEDRTKKLKIVTKKHLKEAFDTYAQEKEQIEYNKIEQTDEERRHRENIDNNNRLHLENIKIQNDHFIQQLLIQIASHGNFNSLYPTDIASNVCLKTSIVNNNGLFSEKDLPKSWSEKVLTLISDEQMNQYHDIMTNTFQRRVNEKRVRDAARANSWW